MVACFLPVVLSLVAACNPRPPAAYEPLFPEAAAAAKSSTPGSIAADYALATSGTSLEDAAERLQSFLSKHPRDAETEDAVEQRYIDAATYELMRVYYLLGRPTDGDRLFNAADPLQRK
jgi:hypothetical protein